jgi:hypothetical protein
MKKTHKPGEKNGFRPMMGEKTLHFPESNGGHPQPPVFFQQPAAIPGTQKISDIRAQKTG